MRFVFSWILAIFLPFIISTRLKNVHADELICAESQCDSIREQWLLFHLNNSCSNCSHCWNQNYSFCTYLQYEDAPFCLCDHRVPKGCQLGKRLNEVSSESAYTCYSAKVILPLPPLKIVESNLNNFTIGVPNVQNLNDYWQKLNLKSFDLRLLCPEADCTSHAFDNLANETFVIKNFSLFDRDEHNNVQKSSQQINKIFHWSDLLNDKSEDYMDAGLSADYTVEYNKNSLVVGDRDTVEQQSTMVRNHSDPIKILRSHVDELILPSGRSINAGLIVLLIILTLLFVGMILACITRRHTMRHLVSQKKAKKKNMTIHQKDATVVYKTKTQSPQEEEWKLLPTSTNADKSESSSPLKAAQKNDVMHKYVDICRNATIIPLSHLDLLEIIGQGQFGPIKRGYIGQKNECMVHCAKIPYKTLDDDAKIFLEHLDSSVKASSHPNVISFVGLCDQGEDLYVAMQLETGPNLRNLLRESRSLDHFLQYAQSHGRISLMSSQRLLSIMLGVARGMNYLEENKVLHDNLAAVNIVIGENGVPKIGGYGMATICDLYTRQIEKNHKRLRWLPPETLTEHLFSLKSQIWSFGVVLWEIVTLGGSPYYELSEKNVMHEVPIGIRLIKPINCSFKLYDLMTNCWRKEAESRPNFNEILRCLQDFNLNPEEHIDLNNTPNFTYEPIKQLHDGSL